jgi:hypothetical protein
MMIDGDGNGRQARDARSPQRPASQGGDVHPMTAPPRHSRERPAAAPSERRLADIVLAGAHGGAGTSTLAALLAPAWDAGAAWIAVGGLRPGGRPLVLVARSTVAAAGRALTAATTAAAAGVPVAVLAVVGDGLPEPAEARYRFMVLEGRVGAVVRVPFVPAFRAAADPRQVRLPRSARQALTEIRALAGDQAPWPPRSPQPQGRF